MPRVRSWVPRSKRSNRRPYYDDETLEGPRLVRVQIIGVLLLVSMTIGLPLYWILEPSRQAGAVTKKEETFVEWGRELFETTANAGFNCAGCHGGMKATGGQAPTAVTDPKTGEVRAVNWYAPALNTVLYRFTGDEVKFILDYGRTFSPMSAWGTIGGGPMNVQQIETIIAYIRSIQLEPESCLTEPAFPAVSRLTDLKPLKICDEGVLPEAERSKIDRSATLAAQKLVDAGKYGTNHRSDGRGIVQSRHQQRGVQLRTLPHRGLELRQPRRAGPGRVRLEPHGWLDRIALPERTGHDRLHQERF